MPPHPTPALLFSLTAFPRSEALKLWSGVLTFKAQDLACSDDPGWGQQPVSPADWNALTVSVAALGDLKQELTGCLSASLVPSLVGTAE